MQFRRPPDSTKYRWASSRLRTLLPQLGLHCRPSTCELISRSPTNWAVVYKIKTRSGTYALRVSNRALSSITQRIREGCVNRQLSRRHLAPHLIFSRAGEGISLSAFVPTLVHDRHDCVSIALFLRRLHSSRIAIHESLIAPKIDWSLRQIRRLASQTRKLEQLNEAGERFLYLQSRLEDDCEHPRFCHGDLNKGNLLRTPNGYRVVDFDHAYIGDTMFDVATLCVALRLDRARVELLLDAYLGRAATNHEKTRLAKYRELAMLRYGVITAAHIDDVVEIDHAGPQQLGELQSFGYLGSFTPAQRNLELYRVSLAFLREARAGWD